MAKHAKPSGLQSWSSFLMIFVFALALGAAGAIIRVQGGLLPGVTDNRPNPEVVNPPPQAMEEDRSNPSEHYGTANRRDVNELSLAAPPVVITPSTSVPPAPPKTPTPSPSTSTPKPTSTTPKPETNLSVSASLDHTFDLLAKCESSGDWNINTGNGYYGGLQISLSTWKAYGGSNYASRPDLATEEEQKLIAIKIQAGQGWGAWPSCSAQLGLL